MKRKRPGAREILILIGTFIVSFLLFHYWDQVKLIIAGLLDGIA